MSAKKNRVPENSKENPKDFDPVKGETAAETLGVAFGAAAGGAAAGVAGLAMGGPAGMVVGAITGGLAGAYAAKSVEAPADLMFDTAFWQDRYPASSYYDENIPFEMYEPACRLGWNAYDDEDVDRMKWDEREAQLKREWESKRESESSVRLDWSRASDAAHDAYDHASRIFQGRRTVTADMEIPVTTGTTRPR